MRTYLLKEAFQHFWTYTTRSRAERFLKDWLARAMRSETSRNQKGRQAST